MTLQQRYNTKAAALYRDKVRLELVMFVVLIDFKVSVVLSPPPQDITDQILGNVAISFFFLIVVPCILITLKFFSPANAPLYYTYKMLKCTVKISHVCSYICYAP